MFIFEYQTQTVMKKLFLSILVIFSVFSFSYGNDTSKELEKLVKQQSIISEQIFETYLFKDTEDWKEVLEKKVVLFETNQKLLLEISKKEYLILENLIEENISLWDTFETLLNNETEKYDEKVFELSSEILLSHEQIISVATNGVYLN